MAFSVKILGCGTSGGVPTIDTGWGACDPQNPKNYRHRSSIYINLDSYKLLVDVSPDFRNQYLKNQLDYIDGIFLTHTHADHLNGIDDLRAVCNKYKKPIDFFVYEKHWDIVQHRFGYCFQNLDYHKFGTYFMPALQHHCFTDYDSIPLNGYHLQTFLQKHGKGVSLGLRINNFAYSTDVNAFYSKSSNFFHNLDVWVIDCLRAKPHPTHLNIDNILELHSIYHPNKMYLTHMDNSMDYDTLSHSLPPHIQPAYDGQNIYLA